MSKSKLDSLRSTTSAPAEATPAEAVWVIYAGKVGPTQHFDHEGNCCFIRGKAAPLVLSPGLNILTAATWAAYADHKPVVERMTSKQIVVHEGRSFSPPEMRTLAKVSTSPDALEILLRIEASKEIAGAPGVRRDPTMVTKLTARLKRYVGARVIDISDVPAAAATQTAMANAVSPRANAG